MGLVTEGVGLVGEVETVAGVVDVSGEAGEEDEAFR